MFKMSTTGMNTICDAEIRRGRKKKKERRRKKEEERKKKKERRKCYAWLFPPFSQWAISAFHFSWFCVHVYNAVFVPRGAGSPLASLRFYRATLC